MFKTPCITEVNILGTRVPVTISEWKCNQEEADALCIDTHIYLKEVYDDYEHFRRCFTHECFHAICEILGCQLDIHMEETLAHCVSLFFTQNQLVTPSATQKFPSVT